MTEVLEDRLAKLDEIPLLVGSHSAPAPSCDKPEGCAEEIYTWLFDLPWSDRPNDHVSPVIAAFMRRLNDGLPDDLRQQLKPYLIKQHGTAGDGHDEARATLAANWVIHKSLPLWVELAGATETAERLRALPEFKAETRGELRTVLIEVRDEMWKRSDGWREKIRKAVRVELEKRGIKGAAAVVAAADAAAVDADAADADAADAADAGRSGASYWTIRRAVYDAIKDQVAEKVRPTTEAIFPSALELLDEMCAMGKA